MTSQTKTPDDIRKEYIEASNKAKLQKQYLTMLNSCSEADRKSVELLEKIDISSGGNLPRLYQTYMAIKQSS